MLDAVQNSKQLNDGMTEIVEFVAGSVAVVANDEMAILPARGVNAVFCAFLAFRRVLEKRA
jgi:hypothetical protein